MSTYESNFWHEWWDEEALETERLESDIEQYELEHPEETEDYGGAYDGFGVISDSDPGL